MKIRGLFVLTADNIIHVIKSPPEMLSEKTSLVVIQDELHDVKLDFQENRNTITLRSEKLLLTVSKKDGAIGYFDLDNKIILKEEGEPAFTHIGSRSLNDSYNPFSLLFSR